MQVLKAVRHLPLEEHASEMLSAVRENVQLDAETERRGKVAALFCKAYERTSFTDAYIGKCSHLGGKQTYEAG